MFIQGQVCRLNNFRTAFLDAPDRLCPGIVPMTFSECYSAVLRTWIESPGLDTSGLMLMSSVALIYLTKQKASFPDRSEVIFAMSNIYWSNLDGLNKRVTPDRFSKQVTNSSNLAAIETETAELMRNDRLVAKQFAGKLLEQASKLLDGLEGRLGSDQSTPALKLKLRILKERGRFAEFRRQ